MSSLLWNQSIIQHRKSMRGGNGVHKNMSHEYHNNIGCIANLTLTVQILYYRVAFLFGVKIKERNKLNVLIYGVQKP